MSNFTQLQPATSAPENAVAYAKKVKALPTREYGATKDHGWTYEAGTYVDHRSDAARRAAFEILSLHPRVTKKEAQFALGFQTPKHVTAAANAWAKEHESNDHRVVRPAPFRPLAPEFRPTKAEAPQPEPEAPKAPAKPKRVRKAPAKAA